MALSRLARLALGAALPLLVACTDRAAIDAEMASVQARMRLGLGDLGPEQSEAQARSRDRPAGARRFLPGDRFHYVGGVTHEVAEVDGLVVVWNEGPDRRRVATLNPAFPPFLVETPGGRYVREIGGDAPEGLFPLGQPRQNYNIRRQAVVVDEETGEPQPPSVALFRYECDARPPATVDGPLGPQGVVPVACRYFSGTRMSQRAVQTYDMAPELGYWVRFTETDLRGEVRRQVWLTGIEPGGWLRPATKARLGSRLREVLEHRPSGAAVPFTDTPSGLSGFFMTTATFALPDERFCRAFVITVIGAGDVPIDYPGQSCREGGRWQLWDGF